MNEHIWRQGYGIDRLREWIRRELPGGPDGLVVEDADLMIRRYGPRYQLDQIGDLMIIEKKEESGKITVGQKFIYNWIDTALKSSVYADRWRGWHLVHIEHKEPVPLCPTCKQPWEDTKTALDKSHSMVITVDGGPAMAIEEWGEWVQWVSRTRNQKG